MRTTIALALMMATALPALAQAEDMESLFGASALGAEEMSNGRGGSEVLVPGVTQVTETSQNAGNSGNAITVGNGARMSTGDIYTAHVTGNNGITAVMQNTGNLVNMNNATSINVYTR